MYIGSNIPPRNSHFDFVIRHSIAGISLMWKMRNEIETKRNEINRNEIHRNETKSKRNEINRNEIDQNETKRNNSKWNKTYFNERISWVSFRFDFVSHFTGTHQKTGYIISYLRVYPWALRLYHPEALLYSLRRSRRLYSGAEGWYNLNAHG
jgi:hypothetical protein